MHFENLCDDDDTKDWIEKILKVFPIFLVTGLLTVTKAEVGRAHQRSSEVQLSAEVAPSDVISSGATTILGNVPDAFGVDIGAGIEVNCLYSFVAPGERIIGVQYRKLTFKRFPVIDVDKTQLKKNSWVMFLGDRSHKGIDESLGDILEANLEDELTMNDLELEGEDGEEFTDLLENDEFVFLDE